MKTVISLCALLLLGFTSCKKKYTCTCYDHSGNLAINSQIKARNADKAFEECTVDYNPALHSSCGAGL